VPALCDALAASGSEVHLITGVPNQNTIQNNFPGPATQTHKVIETGFTRQWGVASGFRLELSQLSRNSDRPTIVHDHGLWLPSNHAVAKECKALGLKRVVSPRGMLSGWSMNRRRTLKRCLWKLYQERDLRSADAFVATSELEAADIRSHGFTQPMVVIPNGIQFPSELPCRRQQSGKQILFLSRIHPVKGVMELVEAFAHAQLSQEWRLVIAGPDEDGYQKQVVRRVHELGISDRVTFPGSKSDTDKWQLLADSDLFVLPSFTENFGIVIAEAMAAGLPVITTNGTPWKVLQSEAMGWWIPPTVEELTVSLADACTLASNDLESMGRRASKYAHASFTWNEIAQRVVEFYSSII
jgi:glycosyltransferase involved in cell wall biosynthesis